MHMCTSTPAVRSKPPRQQGARFTVELAERAGYAARPAMHAAWPIAAAGALVPRPVAVAPRVAPRAMKAADLLSFERQGYWLDRGLLDKAQVQALAPALDRVYEEQAHAVLRQKVRVVLGDDALSQAEASCSSLRAQTKVRAWNGTWRMPRASPLGHVRPERGSRRLR